MKNKKSIDGRYYHGFSDKIPEYCVWKSMRKRCLNPRDKFYHRYGGRGIRICRQWADFGKFYADMGPRPGPKFTLDRINNDGPYAPGNCRWATQTEQALNRSKPTHIRFWKRRDTRGYRGVDLLPSGKFRAKCKKVHIGVFATAREAALAYNKAATKRFGEFACLNVLQELNK